MYCCSAKSATHCGIANRLALHARTGMSGVRGEVCPPPLAPGFDPLESLPRQSTDSAALTLGNGFAQWEDGWWDFLAVVSYCSCPTVVKPLLVNGATP